MQRYTCNNASVMDGECRFKLYYPAHVQGGKVIGRVVVVVSRKIAISGGLGT